MKKLAYLPVKTRPLLPPKDDLLAALKEALPTLEEGDVVALTSKVVAIDQGRTRPVAAIARDDLILQEAERYLPRDDVPHRRAILTLKGHTLISSAGIDQSNGNDYYVLWPERPQAAARFWWRTLRKEYGVKDLGVILTDSHSIPQRLGAVGVAIGFCGFEPLRDYRGVPDIFGRPLKTERANLVDPLAALGVFMMGEAAEQTPAVILRGLDQLVFTDQPRPFFLQPEQDIFRPLLDVLRSVNRADDRPQASD